MSLYRNNQGEIKDINPSLHASWISSGNPKSTIWRLIVEDTPPTFDPATHKLAHAYVLDGSNFRKTWSLVALSQPEIDAAADSAEREAVRNLRAQIALDIDESLAEQAKNQAFIDLTPANRQTQRDAQILDLTRQLKSLEQRFRRSARIDRCLVKQP